MTWIFLAISSHFLWALENVASKYLVGKRIANPYVFLSLLTILSAVWILLIPFINFFVPERTILLLLVLSGVLYFFGGLPYIKAIQIEEVTRINILWNLIPIMSLFLGYFIGDSLSMLEFAAMFILIIGGILASIHSRGGSFSFSKAFWLMFLSCFLYSLYGVVILYITQRIPFSSAFVWLTIFEGLTAIIFVFLFSKIRSDFKETIRACDRSLTGIILGIVAIAGLGIFLNQWALSLKPAALIFSFEGFQVIFVFIMALLLTRFYPQVLEEEIDKSNLKLKLIAMFLMLAGVAVLYLG